MATAENITRRLFLRSVPPALAVGTAVAVPAAAEVLTPAERLERARDEFVEATKAAYPEVKVWKTHAGDGESFAGLFWLIGHRP